MGLGSLALAKRGHPEPGASLETPSALYPDARRGSGDCPDGPEFVTLLSPDSERLLDPSVKLSRLDVVRPGSGDCPAGPEFATLL
jgi:hypothetical protein